MVLSTLRKGWRMTQGDATFNGEVYGMPLGVIFKLRPE